MSDHDGEVSDAVLAAREAVEAAKNRHSAPDPEIANEMNEETSRAMEAKFATLEDSLRVAVETHMSAVTERYRAHADECILGRQTDVLRANKVIREVSRELGPDWKGIYQCLTAVVEDKDAVQSELEKIERQRPFLQPYKALVAWRDLRGSEFNIMDLIDQLSNFGKFELADKAVAILNVDNEALMKLDNIGKGIASGVERVRTMSEDGASGEVDKCRNAVSPSSGANGYGHAEDRMLLALSKKLGGSWLRLGQVLGVSDEDMQEIQENETEGYHAAFKMLWTWRDIASEIGTDNTDTLAEALTKIGQKELISLMK